MKAGSDVLRYRGGDVGLCAPAGHRVAERQRAELVQVVAIPGRSRISPTALEQNPRGGHRQRKVGPRTRLDERLTKSRGFVPDGINQQQPGAPARRILEDRHRVRRGDDDVLSPEQDVSRIQQVEEVVGVFLAEVEQLRFIARPGADVAALDGHRPELGEEVVGEMFQGTE
jgi:hypothetical protein